ncbi:MAG: flagellar protein export ATPase FliI [Firmicutes bacterium]|nr:flagellar protein export ATPase FliI [Bacillota bacterium]
MAETAVNEHPNSDTESLRAALHRVHALLESARKRVGEMETVRVSGRVVQVIGLTIESMGPEARIGELCWLYPRGAGAPVQAEVVGFRDRRVLLMPLGDMEGVAPGCEVRASGQVFRVPVGPELLGRVLDGLGRPIDGRGPLTAVRFRPVSGHPPNPLARRRIDRPLELGVRAVDACLTVGRGQRIGIFSGSGVGKSTLLGMVARNTAADVNVIALVGERGREVREFLETDLGEEGLRRSVVVVATSDQPALVRLKGAQVATAIAEFFRDQGRDVILMMDSVTRWAMAQREVGLAIGEPPATRGYTPSVFANLPRLLERSGMGERGSITGLYTVLVDGDDLNEPIADAVRGILDGHIVLSRQLAALNHYPAIDVLQSVSRVMEHVTEPAHRRAAARLREVLAVYQNARDLIEIGAYVAGSNPRTDWALGKIEAVNQFLQQDRDERCTLPEAVAALEQLFSDEGGGAGAEGQGAAAEQTRA